MTLAQGTRLGPSEITAPIGAGGMGEVFRARDTKLNRDVAIKMLPAAFADDPERLARFTQEAQTLASLNHPNIATIHGIEEVPAVSGSTGPGSRALAMELVEGEDLSAHIARGPIPIAEALPIARQIDWETEGRIVAHRISTEKRTVLVENGNDARNLSTGHLVYTVENALMGIAFDARRLTVSGTAAPLVQEVRRAGAGALYGVGDDGTLVYARGANAAVSGQWLLAMSDRSGMITPLPAAAGRSSLPRVSPDGKRLAVEVADGEETYIAIYDLDGRSALRRLTFGGSNRYPVWSRDSARVTFQSDREGDLAIFWPRADGAGPAERLTKPPGDQGHVPASWSPSDETLLLSVVPKKGDPLGALFTFARTSGSLLPFGGVPSATLGPVFSSDGRWVAYASGGGVGADGTRRVYIQPYPSTGAKYEAPVPRGATMMTHPSWSHDGATLYFSSAPGRFGVVPVTTQPTLAFGNPSELPRQFSSLAPWAPRGSEITPDGRFVGRTSAEEVRDVTIARNDIANANKLPALRSRAASSTSTSARAKKRSWRG